MQKEYHHNTLKYQFDEDLKNIAKENDVNVDDVYRVILFIFEQIMIWMTDPRLPKITITYLGNFSPEVGKIAKLISMMVGKVRRNNYSKSNFREKWEWLKKVSDRLRNEKNNIPSDLSYWESEECYRSLKIKQLKK